METGVVNRKQGASSACTGIEQNAIRTAHTKGKAHCALFIHRQFKVPLATWTDPYIEQTKESLRLGDQLV